MSDPIDDTALDEYLKGGSLVSQRYRELGVDDVPPELDRRILQQAAAAAGRRPARSRAWVRWSAPLALAASAVLVLSIVMNSGVQQRTIRASKLQGTPDAAAEAERKSEAPPPEKAHGEVTYVVPLAVPPRAPAVMPPEAAAPAQAAFNAAPPAESASKVVAAAPRASEGVPATGEIIVTGNRRSAVVSQSVAPIDTQSTAIAQTTVPRQTVPRLPESGAASRPSEVDEIAVTGQRAPRARRAGPRGTVSRDFAAPSGADVAEPRTYHDPQRWLEDIRQLRKDGKSTEADREWERFRAAFPDYVVADTDLARKKGK